ncbi:hypothetical protein MPSEU_000531900 [Mayamaea pseudoterrestris]|nr:hypothetical protein MPSEU_000531900 [Mayamaea pseudoterrestris]
MNSMLLAASSGFSPRSGQLHSSSKRSTASSLHHQASNALTESFLSPRPARNTGEDDEYHERPETTLRPDFSLLEDLTLSPPLAAESEDQSSDTVKNVSASTSSNQQSKLPSAPPLFQLPPRRDASRSTFSWKRSQPKIAAWDVASVGNASDTMVPVAVKNANEKQTHFSPPQPAKEAATSCHYSSGRDLHESAKLLLNQGHYDQALQAFQAILCAQTARFGVMHASVGAATHNVGVCHLRRLDYKQAEVSLERAVAVRQETLGCEHLEVAASLSKLGAARAALRKYDDAFDNILQAIRIAKDQLGREHKTVAQLYCHLGCFYYEAGELYAAQATFMEAYEIYRAAWPNVSNRDGLTQQMCDTLCNVGSIQSKRKRFGDAILTFTEALDLQRGILVQDHPRVIATLDNLAFAFSKGKEHSKASHCYKSMLQSQLSNDRNIFSDAAMDSFCKMMLMYEKSKRYTDAIACAQETLVIASSRLPPSHKILHQISELIAVLEKKAKKTKPQTYAAKEQPLSNKK